jgi:hypothetical protein
MLQPSGIYTMAVVLRLIEVNTLSHCTVIEKGVGGEMIHLFVAIIKTYSWAGINSNLQSLLITGQLSLFSLSYVLVQILNC